MADWRALEPVTPAGLLTMARIAVRETRPLVDTNARISHVGFRSQSRLEWEILLTELLTLGTRRETFKPDGRPIPFIQLTIPLTIGTEVLEYIEVPAPKETGVEEPTLIVAYQTAGEDRPRLLKAGYDIREQAMHARDFIARDAGRTE
ncbi:MAG: hypothetical protein DI585_05895 [Pseudomonas fluorescens]|nr:MAG: hypothetical protein DI585_05895 [Pseudomonas fluorescens]